MSPSSSSPSVVSSGAGFQGYLYKQGHKVKNWKHRWLVLRRGNLVWFENRDTGVMKGHTALIGAQAEPVKTLEDKKLPEYKFPFAVRSAGSLVLLCSAASSEDRQRWIDKIKVCP